jgi:hypothetical protein
LGAGAGLFDVLVCAAAGIAAAQAAMAINVKNALRTRPRFPKGPYPFSILTMTARKGYGLFQR